MSLFGFLLVRKSLVQSINARLTRMEATQRRQDDALAALNQQGARMSQEILDALAAAKTKLFDGLDRLANEVREMAAKLGAVTDLSAVAAIAAELNAKADAMEALRAEVDTDGSNAPAVEG